jgi:hypothetical protein
MPTEQEQELLALLALEKRRNARPQNRTASTLSELPELTPEVLLSVSAQREVQAAQGGIQAQALTSVARVRETSQQHEPYEPDELPDISSLFMNNEAEAQQALVGGVFTPETPDITFDTDELLEGTTVPNEAVRFQVGRQDPPVHSFHREMHAIDGEVVSQRGQDGQFHTTPRPIRPPQERPRPNEQPQGRFRGRPPQGRSRVPRPEPPPIDRSTIKTAMERVVGPDFVSTPGGAPQQDSSGSAPTALERIAGPSFLDD